MRVSTGVKDRFQIFRICQICMILILIQSRTHAAEYKIESSITSSASYNDNIFLAATAKESESQLTILPKVIATVRDNNWSLGSDVWVSSENYSSRNLDSIDQYLNVQGNLSQERNTYSFVSGYSLKSNLNTNSDDFGVANKKAERRTLRLSPTYTRSFSSRMSIAATLSMTSVDYIDAAGTGLTPYQQNALNTRLDYSFSERDSINLSLTYSEYESDDGLAVNDMFIYRIGMNHLISERLSSSLIVGVSKRNTTNLRQTEINFLGVSQVFVQVLDFNDNGFVLNGNLSYALERGSTSIDVSRDVVANSTGGLSEQETVNLNLNESIISRWRYSIDVKYSKSTAVSSIAQSSDRRLITLKPSIFYNLGRDWRLSASYEYAEREFTSNILPGSTPSANKISISATYNLPSISSY